ncbi:MAG: class I SAM-dependent methyltransferase [Solirubrobacteraceae bacterium]
MLLTGRIVLATGITTYTSCAAIALSLAALGVTLYTYRGRRRDDAYEYLADIWNEIVGSALQHPRFLNVGITSQFDRVMSEDERCQYDAYCYKTWGLIEDMVVKSFHEDPQFKAILEWTVAYHLRWIELNPQFFTLDAFWESIEAVRETPQLVIHYRPLPTANGDIDWDLVSSDYHHHILGPFAPEMLAPDDSGEIRNRLVADLRDGSRFGSLEGKKIADFGCGPGNLVSHLPACIGHLVGVDLSQSALDLATREAVGRGIAFKACRQDLCSVSLGSQFDLIVSVNAILPSTRTQVIEILEGIRRHLRPQGRLLAILPSYDTTLYTRELWRSHYASRDGQAHADRVIRALLDSKLADDELCSYAEDGQTGQCYHTPATISREFEQAGLVIERQTKIYYPWELVRRFDYGYFPTAPEEIWDWYVVAARA